MGRQVEMVGVINLYTSDRYGFDRPHGGDESARATRGLAVRPFLMGLLFAGEGERFLVGGEGDRVRGRGLLPTSTHWPRRERGAVAQGGGAFAHAGGWAPRRDGEGEHSARRPRTGLVVNPGRWARVWTGSRAWVPSRRFVTATCTAPLGLTVPAVSSKPANRSRRCCSLARKYTSGMCLSPSTPKVRSRACTVPWRPWHSAHRRNPDDGAPQSGQVGGTRGGASRGTRPPQLWPQVRTSELFGVNESPQIMHVRGSGCATGNRIE